MKYSIIVPCYKCEDTIERLMDSIVIQNEKDLEVILVNDQEDGDYNWVVEKYNSLFPVKIIGTDFHNHNPGNSRNYGLDAAIGDWILFIDCDDTLRDSALDIFSKKIEEFPNQKVFFGKQKQWHKDGTEFADNEEYQDIHLVWLHGKCYNREFLNEHNIRFIPTMRSCEDYWFNYQVAAHLWRLGYEFILVNQYVYNWLWNDNSLSRSSSYFIDLLPHIYDHQRASLLSWLTIKNDNETVDIQTVYKHFFLQLCMSYFTIQYFRSKDIYINTDIIREALSKVKEVFYIRTFDLINDFESDYDRYIDYYNQAVRSFTLENFVCPESFRTWILNICK